MVSRTAIRSAYCACWLLAACGGPSPSDPVEAADEDTPGTNLPADGETSVQPMQDGTQPSLVPPSIGAGQEGTTTPPLVGGSGAGAAPIGGSANLSGSVP